MQNAESAGATRLPILDSAILPSEFLALLGAMLAKSPAARPDSMSAVAAALESMLRGETPVLPLPAGEFRMQNAECRTQNAEQPTAPPSEFRVLNSAFLTRRRLLTAGLATAAASAAGFGAFTIWNRVAYGTVHLQLPEQGPPVAEILVDNKPIDPRHIRRRGATIELDLPNGAHEIRLLADAHYPSIHLAKVPFRSDLQLTAAFAPAFRWRFTGDGTRSGCIEAAEDAWIGWNLDVDSWASVVRELPLRWSILSQQHPLTTHCLKYNSARSLLCDNLSEWHDFDRSRFDSDHPQDFSWRMYPCADESFALEFAIHPVRGYYLTPKTATPQIAQSAAGRDSFDANPVGVRTRPPPPDLAQPAPTGAAAFWRRVHVVVASGQNGAGLYLGIDQNAQVEQRPKLELAHAVLLSASPTIEWDVIPIPNGHALRVASGKFKTGGWTRMAGSGATSRTKSRSPRR